MQLKLGNDEKMPFSITQAAFLGSCRFQTSLAFITDFADEVFQASSLEKKVKTISALEAFCRVVIVILFKISFLIWINYKTSDLDEVQCPLEHKSKWSRSSSRALLLPLIYGGFERLA